MEVSKSCRSKLLFLESQLLKIYQLTPCYEPWLSEQMWHLEYLELEYCRGEGDRPEGGERTSVAYLFVPMNIYRMGEAVWGDVTEA